MSERDANALAAFLEDRESWTFGYSRASKTHDCARFAGAGVKAVTGVNPLKSFSSEWKTPLGAARVLRRHGGMAAAVSEVMRPINPMFAQRGDVGLTEQGALVLVEGQAVVGVSPEGLRRLPRSAMTLAWSI